MAQIICPNCHTVFNVSDEEYKTISAQVRDREFDREIQKREAELKKSGEQEILLVQSRTREEMQQEIAARDKMIAELKSELTLMHEAKRTEQELAVTKAVSEKERVIDNKDMEITRLNGLLEQGRKEAELNRKKAEEDFEKQLRMKDEEIEQYKNFKAKQSTKMIGESLEVYCRNEFEKVRAMAFPDAYFDKDNKTSDESHSKGDFIFRDYADGVEFVSVMFEMKNEADGTSTKKKNEDFFKELDKDRREKKCEYAVLVSLLEPDNELYNAGIVDVSHKYPKMYVVRPQFFIPIIALIRNAEKSTLSFKKELMEIRNQNMDITHFEENLNAAKERFMNNLRLSGNQFNSAIANIDKTIKNLEEIKENLRLTIKHMQAANNNLDDITIRKLVKGNPTMAAKFEALNQDRLEE